MLFFFLKEKHVKISERLKTLKNVIKLRQYRLVATVYQQLISSLKLSC